MVEIKQIMLQPMFSTWAGIGVFLEASPGTWPVPWYHQSPMNQLPEQMKNLPETSSVISPLFFITPFS